MTRDAVRAAQRPLVVVALLALLVGVLGIAGGAGRGPHSADRLTATSSGAPARTDHGRRAVTPEATPARTSSATAVATWHVDLAPTTSPVAVDRLLAGAAAPTLRPSAATVAGSLVDARAPPGATA